MISRVGIRNFKAFREAEVNLSSLNLFTGLNGMGKSTFIQSLLLLRQSDASFIPDIKGLILKGGESGIIDLGKGKDIYNIHADNDFISFEIDIDYKSYLNVTYTYEAENDVLPLSTSHSHSYNNPGNPALFNNRFTYLKAERISPEHNYKANLAAVKQNQFLGYKGENVPLYIALHKLDTVLLEGVRHKAAKAPNLISNIDAWLNEITPGTHVISTYYNELDIVKVGYQFDNGNDFTPEFSPVNVGYGITYLLPVITAILAAQKGDLIIIENPEAHLHPQGQSKVGELLARAANEGVQIIVESHSDHLFNGIRVAVKDDLIHTDNVSIFYFEHDPSTKEHTTIITQPHIDQNGRVSQKPNGFFDEFSKQLDKLIG
jgi:predicted ATPase